MELWRMFSFFVDATDINRSIEFKALQEREAQFHLMRKVYGLADIVIADLGADVYDAKATRCPSQVGCIIG